MKLITIAPVDNQKFSLDLENGNYFFKLRDTGVTGVFLDVYRSTSPLITGILCLDRVRLIRLAYKRFPGDLVFVDQYGFDNPNYPYFGSRFLLFYIDKDEEKEFL
ncbi:hypothetical protein COMNV_00574 [Commensalibacter sp. Nvir]|uniref:phage baseplate plug family protein n=1 Tax=Commensalibacter sp. Nvir TaxID=3069817 RepID=UPI002D737DE3|nr:hypothetical protein COMNV_00574 [Commensalibacter sp. Nvir]